MPVISILWGYKCRNREREISLFEKIFENRRFLVEKSQLVFSRRVVTNQCCGLALIFCGFISHLIGRETINIREIFSGVHGLIRVRTLFCGQNSRLIPDFFQTTFFIFQTQGNSEILHGPRRNTC